MKFCSKIEKRVNIIEWRETPSKMKMRQIRLRNWKDKIIEMVKYRDYENDKSNEASIHN